MGMMQLHAPYIDTRKKGTHNAIQITMYFHRPKKERVYAPCMFLICNASDFTGMDRFEKVYGPPYKIIENPYQLTQYQK